MKCLLQTIINHISLIFLDLSSTTKINTSQSIKAEFWLNCRTLRKKIYIIDLTNRNSMDFQIIEQFKILLENGKNIIEVCRKLHSQANLGLY